MTESWQQWVRTEKVEGQEGGRAVKRNTEQNRVHELD